MSSILFDKIIYKSNTIHFCEYATNEDCEIFVAFVGLRLCISISLEHQQEEGGLINTRMF